MEKLAIGNFKGGVGKTTVAVNLAVALCRQGRRVLLVDTDPSAAVSAHFNVRPPLTLYHLLMEDRPPRDVIYPIAIEPGLFLLPSSRATQAAEFQLAPQLGREHVLEERLLGLSGFHYVVIDTPPSISIVAQNALVYSRRLLIPISMDPMSLLGAAAAFSLCSEIREKLKVDCRILGIIPTFVENRRTMTRLVTEAIEESYPDVWVLPSIRSDAAVPKAVASQLPVLHYDRRCRASEDFTALAAALDQQVAGGRRVAAAGV